jgi:hypothetical protein
MIVEHEVSGVVAETGRIVLENITTWLESVKEVIERTRKFIEKLDLTYFDLTHLSVKEDLDLWQKIKRKFKGVEFTGVFSVDIKLAMSSMDHIRTSYREKMKTAEDKFFLIHSTVETFKRNMKELKLLLAESRFRGIGESLQEQKILYRWIELLTEMRDVHKCISIAQSIPIFERELQRRSGRQEVERLLDAL